MPEPLLALRNLSAGYGDALVCSRAHDGLHGRVILEQSLDRIEQAIGDVDREVDATGAHGAVEGRGHLQVVARA